MDLPPEDRPDGMIVMDDHLTEAVEQGLIDAGDDAEANVYYNKMLELDPVRPDAWLGKARAMAISATLLDFKVEPM
jgi:hypothetical protein